MSSTRLDSLNLPLLFRIADDGLYGEDEHRDAEALYAAGLVDYEQSGGASAYWIKTDLIGVPHVRGRYLPTEAGEAAIAAYRLAEAS